MAVVVRLMGLGAAAAPNMGAKSRMTPSILGRRHTAGAEGDDRPPRRREVPNLSGVGASLFRRFIATLPRVNEPFTLLPGLG